MAGSWDISYGIVKPYNPPEWTSGLSFVPKHKLQLASLPTPVQRWNLRRLPEEFKLYIKRDDLTGCALSGNKVRKLEFTLAEALSSGCKYVITTGPTTSNHCRATSVAAAQVGLKCLLLLRSLSLDKNNVSSGGNMFMNRLCGASIYLTPYHLSIEERLEMQQQLAEKIKTESGDRSYVLPAGGSDTFGLFGYVEAFRELIEQGMLDHITDIAFACATGGTAAGLTIANHLTTNSRIRIHAFLVYRDSQYIHNHCDAEFKKLGLSIRSKDVLSCVEDYKDPAYRVEQEDDLEFISRVGKETGVILDPAYTGKAARRLFQEITTNSQRFKGKEILFLHTGGIFGAMDHEQLLETLKGETSGTLHTWAD